MNEMITYVLMAQRGEEEGFCKLYDMFAKKAFYTALKICNYCEADAQDVVQDTFLEVHRSIGKLNKPENFKSWMIRILISKSSHKFRDNRDLFVEPETFLRMEGYQEQRSYMIPGVKMNDDEDKKVLMLLVDQLKPKQKEVLVLQYFHTMSIKEISEVLDIPEGTVKSRIMYARNQLKELVKEYECREGRRLGFHSDAIGSVLASAFFMEFQHLQLPKVLVSVRPKRAFQHASLVQSLSLGACAVVSGIVVTGAAAWYLNDQAGTNTPIPVVEQNARAQTFRAVMYRDEVISNCRDAYYTLKEWAQNAQKIEKRPIDEKLAIQPVYEELKAVQGVYYDKLVKENWTAAFEAR